jgi:putative inorganic carbon (hco3(-)) transporter
MHPAALFAIAFMTLGAVFCAFRPKWVPAYFAAVLYSNAPDTLRQEYGIPSFFMFLAPALVALAIARHVLFSEPFGEGWKAALWWLLAWGAVNLASFLYAMDPALTAKTLLDYLDAVFIVAITALFLRQRDQLGSVVWALIGVGAFLSVLTVHQTITGNFASTYGGFARGELRGLLEGTEGMRSAGPLSTNYFGLILVALVPLAADRVLHARSRLARFAAFGGFALIVGAIGCTYSRGAFATLAAIALFTLLLSPKWPKIVLAAAPLALIALLVLPKTYVERMSTFGQIWDGLRGRYVADTAIRGRLSEVRSALMMMGNHPMIGVGSGNYEIHYQQYARVIALDGRNEERAAHSLYLEVAAENGLIGLAVFGGFLLFALRGLQRSRQAFGEAGDDELVHLTTAVGIAFVGFLMGSTFLHLSYPRFFWLMVGIAMAVGAFSAGQVAPKFIPMSRALTATRSGAGEVHPCA